MNTRVVGYDDTNTRLVEVKVENHALKVIGNNDAEMNTSLNNIETTLTSHSGYIDEIETHLAKITKGNAPTGVGGELQQVLMYGKKPDGTLQPLETLGDRLLVDVLELSASGQITTSTALSSVQACGYDTTTSKFKTLNVDSNGSLNTISSSSASFSSEVVYFSTQSVPGSGTFTGATINVPANTKQFVVEFVVSNNSMTFLAQSSIDGTTWYDSSAVLNLGASLSGMDTLQGNVGGGFGGPTGFSPYLRVIANNGDPSSQTATVSYVIQTN